jgi:hypothetical protein
LTREKSKSEELGIYSSLIMERRKVFRGRGEKSEEKKTDSSLLNSLEK